MDQDKVVSLIVDMMGVTMKVALPMLLVAPDRRPADLDPAGRHADPGADALLHPEDPRAGRGRRDRRPVDAGHGRRPGRPSSGSRSRTTSAPSADGSANELLARFSEQQVAAFFLVLCRISPLFILAPLFSSKMIPRRVRAIIARRPRGRPDAGRQARRDRPRSARLRHADLQGARSSASRSPTRWPRCSPRLQVAGTLLDTLIGFSFGSLVDPVTGTQSSVLDADVLAVRRRDPDRDRRRRLDHQGPRAAPTRRSRCSTTPAHRLDGRGRAGRVLGHLRRRRS